MKRYTILAVAVVGLSFLFLHRHERNQASPPSRPGFATEAPTATDPPETQSAVINRSGEPAAQDSGSVQVATNQESYQRFVEMRAFNESPDVDVAFHGLVIDQDSNALQNVNVDISVTQWDSHAPPGAEVVTTKIESQTGPDGRFYVQGLKGHSTTVLAFTKDGYEPETGIRRNYGEYLPQVTSFLNPVVFKMWKTNLHEPLVAGERSFVITPDGRHYAIDL